MARPHFLSSGGVRTNAGSPRSGWGFRRRSRYFHPLFFAGLYLVLVGLADEKAVCLKIFPHDIFVNTRHNAQKRTADMAAFKQICRAARGRRRKRERVFGKNFIRDFRNLRSCGKAQRNGRGKIWLRKKCGLQSRELNGGRVFWGKQEQENVLTLFAIGL